MMTGRMNEHADDVDADWRMLHQYCRWREEMAGSEQKADLAVDVGTRLTLNQCRHRRHSHGLIHHGVDDGAGGHPQQMAGKACRATVSKCQYTILQL
jgi:hypothetical protein